MSRIIKTELMKWTDWMKQYPKLEEIWQGIPEPLNTLLKQQIDNFAQEQVKNCDIADVSHQRGLLLAFAMRELREPISDFNREGFEKIVDNFLANNSG